jgi:hypothetical protein
LPQASKQIHHQGTKDTKKAESSPLRAVSSAAFARAIKGFLIAPHNRRFLLGDLGALVVNLFTGGRQTTGFSVKGVGRAAGEELVRKQERLALAFT